MERIKRPETSQIEELIINRLPWPNVFTTGEEEPGWEEIGLEVIAVTEAGSMILPPEEYKVTGFNSETPNNNLKITVSAEKSPEKSADFLVVILDSAAEYNKVSPVEKENGKIIPYPSVIPAGSVEKVSLFVYPKEDYRLVNGSLKINGVLGGGGT
jgi:hypothetical protein